MYNIYMKSLRVECPAKINLNLKIKGVLPNGYHEIESIMQTISLYDYLDISVEKNENSEIILSGNSIEIPYDKTNLVSRAAELFYKTVGLNSYKTLIHIDKNIPVSAGLAGGSTDAAGTIYGLNHLFQSPLSHKDIHIMCAQLGSDLNVCLAGGRILAQGRGEKITSKPYESFNVSLIKPLGLGISAKEAYTKFSKKMELGLSNREQYKNDLEWAVIDDYEQLQFIKQNYPESVMTGSGSAYYLVNGVFREHYGYYVKNNLTAISTGVRIIK